MTPGPTRVPERVLRAADRVIHHRTPEFAGVIHEVLLALKPHFGTLQGEPMPVHATGRASMEAILLNAMDRGEEVIVCCNGKFGEMWAGFAERAELAVRRVSMDWDCSVDPQEVADALHEHPAASAVLVCHSDTSTGVLNPIAEIAGVARERGVPVMVDGVSSVAGAPFLMDEWGVDVAITSTQKCLMSSPGLSFAVIGDAGWTAIGRTRRQPPSYFDLAAIRQKVSEQRPETPGTAPVSLMMQVRESLRLMGEEEGAESQIERNRANAARLRSWALEKGFSLQGGDGLLERSPTVTALVPPSDIDAGALRWGMLPKGVLVAGGLGAYTGKAIRIAHMGDIRAADIETTIAVLEETIAEMRAR